MPRKYIDCRESPIEKNCTIAIYGTEEEVLDLAVMHACTTHDHKDFPHSQGRVCLRLTPVEFPPPSGCVSKSSVDRNSTLGLFSIIALEPGTLESLYLERLQAVSNPDTGADSIRAKVLRPDPLLNPAFSSCVVTGAPCVRGLRPPPLRSQDKGSMFEPPSSGPTAQCASLSCISNYVGTNSMGLTGETDDRVYEYTYKPRLSKYKTGNRSRGSPFCVSEARERSCKHRWRLRTAKAVCQR